MLMLPANPGYTVEVADVREVNLLGQADLTWWQQQLADEGLTPFDANGHASLLISATSLRWMGVRFREWSLSVALCQTAHCAVSDAFYLAQAFNSSRMFALIERRMLRTPYDHAHLRLTAETPALMQVGSDPHMRFQAAMTTTRPPIGCHDERWEGPLFLPSPADAKKRYLFYAQLTGPVDVYPWLASDTLQIDAQAGGIWHNLHDSGFTPTEWWLRAQGVHGKSRTLRWQ